MASDKSDSELCLSDLTLLVRYGVAGVDETTSADFVDKIAPAALHEISVCGNRHRLLKRTMSLTGLKPYSVRDEWMEKFLEVLWKSDCKDYDERLSVREALLYADQCIGPVWEMPRDGRSCLVDYVGPLCWLQIRVAGNFRTVEERTYEKAATRFKFHDCEKLRTLTRELISVLWVSRATPFNDSGVFVYDDNTPPGVGNRLYDFELMREMAAERSLHGCVPFKALTYPGILSCREFVLTSPSAAVPFVESKAESYRRQFPCLEDGSRSEASTATDFVSSKVRYIYKNKLDVELRRSLAALKIHAIEEEFSKATNEGTPAPETASDETGARPSQN